MRSEAAHSAALLQRITQYIDAAGGCIDFETFMDLALYAPGLGYYSAGSTKIGAAGDFTTAPEVSELFARCVARQCAQILAATPGGSILELGAGTGSMAATRTARTGGRARRCRCTTTSWRSARIWPSASGSASRTLPEPSCARACAGCSSCRRAPHARVSSWPMRCWTRCRAGGSSMREATVEELGVTHAADGTLAWARRPADAALSGGRARAERGRCRRRCRPGYTSELCLLRRSVGCKPCGACSTRGAMLLFDYGLPRAQYYHPERAAGTLTCHFKHRAHFDPLVNVGVQDITAWVDFTRVALAGHAGGPRGAGLLHAGGISAGRRHR